MAETEKKTALVVGAGDSLGGAISRRFAREGYALAVTRRNPEKLADLVKRIEDDGGEVHPFGSDARREDQVAELVETVERDIGPIEVAIHNIGANVNFPINETTTRVFYKVWELACKSAFLIGREVARRMVERGRGTILFTGATASVRGAAGFAAFASGMHGKRALAQSMARELGPQNIHVAHIVIDGPIDTPFTRERFPELIAERPPDGILLPEDIAENYWRVHCQPRSAWTHELDVRPFLEPW
jgi:NAD(P)-dependent dehydrogenase (short-subunit alcohol dehydrogenase family)